MSPLVKKEIRLILPAWIMAMSLAVIPPWLARLSPVLGMYSHFNFLLWVVIAILAIASFSRESSLGTFSQLLAQPVSRQRLWRTKIAVLLLAMLTTFLALFVSWHLHNISMTDLTSWNAGPGISPQAASSFAIEATGIFMVAAIGGGLWTSVLLRQFAGAFWITLLVPIFIVFTTARLVQPHVTESVLMMLMFIVCAIYGAAGFIFAGVAFLRAQDIPWTGATITLPSVTFSSRRARRNKQRGPVAALFMKEFRLQEVNFIFAGALIVLHLAALFAQSHLTQPAYKDVLMILVWLLWMILPALISGSSVAEERRLGTADAGLCLPASRRLQFIIKLIFVLGAGLFVGIGLPMTIEVLTGHHLTPNHDSAPEIFLVALISLISFYGSTLSRNLLQALATSLSLGGIIYVVLDHVARLDMSISHYWNSQIFFWTLTPAMLIAFLYLAFQNFKTLHQGFSLWRRNISVVTLTFLAVASLNAMAHQRVWEIFLPEPTHGPARFTTENAPTVTTYHGSYKIMLPDGRCWADDLLNFNWLGDRLGGGPGAFLPGTNWLQTGTVAWLTVGIQKDGTLWASQPPAPRPMSVNDLLKLQTDPVQIGTNSDWAEIACNPVQPSALLLKKNGTLWAWGGLWENHKRPDISRQKPRQLGDDTDWSHLVSTCGTFAFKSNGQAYTVDRNSWVIKPCTNCFASTLYLRNESSGHDAYPSDAVVKSDGTLWFFLNRNVYGQIDPRPFVKIQVDSGTNWIAAALCDRSIVAVNKDGSLWKWHLKPADNNDWINHSKLTEQPVRMDSHNDWVAVGSSYSTLIAVAADGTVWSWELNEYRPNQRFASSKKPKRMASIFDTPQSKAQ